MSNPTKIEWTERTWNPIVGCSLASPGCTNCYAMRTAYRMSKNPNTPQYHGTAKLANGKPVFTGKLALVEKALLEPLKRKTPTTYFVNSMGDLFHEEMPDDWIDRVFAVMALCPQHTFQVLTKRADRMRAYVAEGTYEDGNFLDRIGFTAHDLDWRRAQAELLCQGSEDDLTSIQPIKWPLPNVWLGVSVEDQKRANERVPELLATPAAIRFISAEPLLGPVDVSRWLTINWQCSSCRGYFGGKHIETCPDCGSRGGWCGSHKFNGRGYKHNGICTPQPGKGIDQVIVGGESGPNARPMHSDWARNLRDQCKAAGTAFFFKQWGEWAPQSWVHHDTPFGKDCGAFTKEGRFVRSREELTPTHNFEMRRVGKKAAGRLLDGREWNETPEAAA